MSETSNKENPFKNFTSNLVALIIVLYPFIVFILWDYNIYNWLTIKVDSATIIRLIIGLIVPQVIFSNIFSKE